jgi:hypothetical protein
LQDNPHEAIIQRDLFLQVQEEMVRRARLETGTGKRRVYSGKYALSHLVYCAHCGDIYRRTQWWIRGEKIPVWRCISRIEKRKANVDCPSRRRSLGGVFFCLPGRKVHRSVLYL